MVQFVLTQSRTHKASWRVSVEFRSLSPLGSLAQPHRTWKHAWFHSATTQPPFHKVQELGRYQPSHADLCQTLSQFPTTENRIQQILSHSVSGVSMVCRPERDLPVSHHVDKGCNHLRRLSEDTRSPHQYRPRLTKQHVSEGCGTRISKSCKMCRATHRVVWPSPWSTSCVLAQAFV